MNSGKTSLISYAGDSNKEFIKNGISYFWGNVTVTVNGDFGTISYECFNHGAMGGTNNLTFDSECGVTSTTSTTTSTSVPTTTSTTTFTPTTTTSSIPGPTTTTTSSIPGPTTTTSTTTSAPGTTTSTTSSPDNPLQDSTTYTFEADTSSGTWAADVDTFYNKYNYGDFSVNVTTNGDNKEFTLTNNAGEQVLILILDTNSGDETHTSGWNTNLVYNGGNNTEIYVTNNTGDVWPSSSTTTSTTANPVGTTTTANPSSLKSFTIAPSSNSPSLNHTLSLDSSYNDFVIVDGSASSDLCGVLTNTPDSYSPWTPGLLLKVFRKDNSSTDKVSIAQGDQYFGSPPTCFGDDQFLTAGSSITFTIRQLLYQIGSQVTYQSQSAFIISANQDGTYNLDTDGDNITDVSSVPESQLS